MSYYCNIDCKTEMTQTLSFHFDIRDLNSLLRHRIKSRCSGDSQGKGTCLANTYYLLAHFTNQATTSVLYSAFPKAKASSTIEAFGDLAEIVLSELMSSSSELVSSISM